MVRNNVVVQGGSKGVFATFYYIPGHGGSVEVQAGGKMIQWISVYGLSIGKDAGYVFKYGQTVFCVYKATQTQVRVCRMNGRMKLQQREGTLPPGFKVVAEDTL